MIGVFVRVGSNPRFPWTGYIIQESGCWEWTGRLNEAGYGIVSTGLRKRERAHRIVYESNVGPVPVGLELDHLCRNRSCVNPSHMEPVTHKENCLRGKGPTSDYAKRTHCKNGHLLTVNTTGVLKGTRVCVLCKRTASLERHFRVVKPARQLAQRLRRDNASASAQDKN